jgi:hypothetical protein
MMKAAGDGSHRQRRRSGTLVQLGHGLDVFACRPAFWLFIRLGRSQSDVSAIKIKESQKGADFEKGCRARYSQQKTNKGLHPPMAVSIFIEAQDPASQLTVQNRCQHPGVLSAIKAGIAPGEIIKQEIDRTSPEGNSMQHAAVAIRCNFPVWGCAPPARSIGSHG